MKRNFYTLCRAILAFLVSAMFSAASSDAQTQGYQTQGYQSPNFAGLAAASQQHQRAQQQVFPASLLAGGPAAAQGNDFVDVHGKPIVLQTQFAEACPPGFGGGFAGGGHGDPMAIDFGGYGQDQVGPHYFDVALDAIFLVFEDAFDDAGVLASVGPPGLPATDFLLNTQNGNDEFEAGFRVAARYDVGALALLEGTYFGIYDIGSSQTVNGPVDPGPPANPFTLNSVFSGFGLNDLILGIDVASSYTLDYQADLQSTEFSYRRYWVGNNPRISGTWLLGARYVRFTEDVNFLATAQNPATGLPVNSSFTLSGDNDLVGFQFGGDGSIGLRQGLRITFEGKSGVYNNRFEFSNAGNFGPVAQPPGPPVGTILNDFSQEVDGNQVAFVAEGGVSLVADVFSSWSFRGGYQVLYLNSIASPSQSLLANAGSSNTPVSTQDHALFHGFHGGLESVW